MPTRALHDSPSTPLMDSTPHFVTDIFSPQRRPRLIVDRSTVDGTKVSFDHDDELELFEKESCNESAESLHHDHNILHAGLKLSFGSLLVPEL